MSFYYLGVAFHGVGLNVGSAIEVSAFSVLALSGLTMFLLVRHIWNIPSALLSAGLYVYAPYHLVDAFVRGAYSELASFVWFPLIPLFMLLWDETRQKAWLVAGGVSVAGLIVTHNIMPMIFLPAMPVFGLAILWNPGEWPSKLKTLAGWSGMAVLGALLSAYFWVPVAFSRGFIHPGYFLQFDYQDEFVGIGPLLTTTINHSLTTEIGVPILLAVAAGLAGVGLSKRLEHTRRLVFASLFLTLGFIFMANYRSEFLWSRVKLLQFVQYPWRFLAPIDFFLCLVAGALPAAARTERWRWGLALGLVLFAVQVHQPLIRIPHTVNLLDVRSLAACDDVWDTQDYRPAWSNAAFWHGPDAPSTSTNSPVLPPCTGRPAFGNAANGSVASFSVSDAAFRLTYQATSIDTLDVPIFYFPSWHVRVDGVPVETMPQPDTGLIQLDVKPGSHLVEGTLGMTSSQLIGIYLSVMGILALGLVAAWGPLARLWRRSAV